MSVGMSVLFEFDAGRGVVCADVRVPHRASFSSLDVFAECPGRWAGSRLLPVARGWGSPLVLGGICHAALELAVNRRLLTGVPDWRGLCREAIGVERARVQARGWGDDPIPSGVVDEHGRVVGDDDWAAAAAVKLDGFSLSMALGRVLTPGVAEQELEATVHGVPMSGSVDYRDASGVLVDWKTGRVPSDGSRHADQLRVYRLMLSAVDACERVPVDGRMVSRPVAPVDVHAAADVYVESRRVVEADLSDEACADTGERLRVSWERMRVSCASGVFALRPSGLCGWCPLANACPRARIFNAKAREAARSSVNRFDSRVAFHRTHTSGMGPMDDGLLSVLMGGSRTDKESDMDDDLLALMMGDASAPEASEASPEPESKPESANGAQASGFAPDPWAGEKEAGAALDRWGVAGASSTSDGEAAPGSVKTSVEPPAADTLVFGVAKPYDPTLAGNRVNVAGYGFSQLQSTAAYAALLCGAHVDWMRTVTLALCEAGWSAVRAAYGPLAPDIDWSKPDPAMLLAWLDGPLSRDADRALRALLDADVLTAPGEPATVDELCGRIRVARERVAGSFKVARSLLA